MLSRINSSPATPANRTAAEDGSGTAAGGLATEIGGGNGPTWGIDGVRGQKFQIGGAIGETVGPGAANAGGGVGNCIGIVDGGPNNAPPPPTAAGITLHTSLNQPCGCVVTFATWLCIRLA